MKPVEANRILLALYEAARRPDGEEGIRRFIAAGADVKRLKYILHRAVRYGSTETVHLLLEHGAALNVARKAGRSMETAMDIALMYADADVAYTLRAAGAKYGYELRGDTAEAERRRKIDPTHPFDLPEPEEWYTAEDMLEYARICTALLGLWHWQWTLRQGDFAGVCSYSEFTLSLNPDYLDRPHPRTRATIIHELAHAMAPRGASHGPIWKLWGAALGQPGMWVPGYTIPSPWVYSLLMKPSRPDT